MPTFQTIKTHTSRLGPRIQSWIDATEPDTPEATDPKPRISRKRPSQQRESNPRPAKRVTRRALASASGNIIPQPTNYTMDPTKQQQKDMPARNTRSSGRINPTTPGKPTRGRPPPLEDNSDDEPTPNANRYPRPQQNLPTRTQLPPRPVLNPRFSEANDAYDFVQDAFSSPSKTSKSRTESTESRSMDGSSDKSGHTKRSTSPVKKPLDFLMAVPPINLERLNAESAGRAGGFLDKYQALVRASYGEGVIPKSLKKFVETHLHPVEHPPLSWYSQQGSAYDDAMGERVLKICEAAWRCEKDLLNEDRWASDVHRALMTLVIENGRYKNGLECHSITDASVSPKSLSMVHLNGSKMEDRKADSTLVLKANRQELEQIKYTIKDMHRDYQSVNQTMMSSIRYHPSFLIAESKIPFHGNTEGDVQLISWASAGIKKLHEMLRDNGQGEERIPPTPLLSFHGHQVHVQALYEGTDSNEYLGKFYVGSTATILGIFQILKALEILVDWGHTEYRAWWFSKVAKTK